MFRHYDFDPLDLLIIHAILNANVLNVMKNPELDRRFGSVQTVEPDEIKQGVSRAALSRFFGLPIETVRRRADRLKKEGILRETDHGLIVTEANQFKFGNNHELQKTNILVVRKFLRDLTETGIKLPGGVRWRQRDLRNAGKKRNLSSHGRVGQTAYQMLLPKKPNRGCCATSITGGATRFFTILRLCCSFGSGFFDSEG
jgi:hypothetical protein